MDLFMICGFIVLAALYCGYGAKRIKLPSLIGYMLLGVALGPSGVNVIDDVTGHDLAFITELALGFVAFSIGIELNMGSLKQLGSGIVAIILAESFMAFIVVFGAVFAVTRDLPMALVFAAMAPASAPAGTVAVIQECKARGSLTKALYAVVGFDDGLAIIIFGFASALAKTLLSMESSGEAVSVWPGMWEACKEIMLSILFGGLIGLLLSILVRYVREKRDFFVLSAAVVMLGVGFSTTFHLSLILTNMVVGFVLANTRRAEVVHDIARELLGVMPLLFILFFTLAGSHLHIDALPSLGMLGIVYIVGRTGGLISGAWVGGSLGKVEEKVRKNVGLGILSQAGVAIGLSLIVRHEFAALGNAHADHIAASVLTTITATCIFFEIVGPICTKIALARAGEIPDASKPR